MCEWHIKFLANFFVLLNRLELLFKKSSSVTFYCLFLSAKTFCWNPMFFFFLDVVPCSLECKYVFLAVWLVAVIYVLSLLQELGSFMTESSSWTAGTLPLPGPRPVVCPRFLGWPFLHTIQCLNCRNSKRSWRRRRIWQVKLLSVPEKKKNLFCDF